MKKVIFDLYGTLIHLHTDENKKSFWIRFSKKMNKYKKYNYKELRKLYLKYCAIEALSFEEIDLKNVFLRLYPNCPPEISAKLFRRLSTRNISLYPGVKGLLKDLKKEGYQIYLLSNAQALFTIYELNKFNLIPYFDGIYLSSDKGIKKPNLNFFKALLNEYNIADATMIGNDYKCDIIPAKALGLNTIYIESDESLFYDTNDKLKGFNRQKIYKKLKKLHNTPKWV